MAITRIIKTLNLYPDNLNFLEKSLISMKARNVYIRYSMSDVLNAIVEVARTTPAFFNKAVTTAENKELLRIKAMTLKYGDNYLKKCLRSKQK